MILLPTPRRLRTTGGHLTLPPSGYIHLAITASDLLPAARAVQSALQTHTQRRYDLVAAGPDTQVVIDLVLSNHIPHAQGYELEITDTNIHITAQTPEGAFHGA
jgi:N-acetyl-beta-hexosaminidase